MIPVRSVLHSFESELVKLQRWSVLAGGAAMVVITALFTYVFASRATRFALSGKNVTSLMDQALPTTHGLATILTAAQTLVGAIAVIIVAASVAGEWSQGTIRNLLVREPARVQLLAGKVLALLLFVVVSAAVALLVGAGCAFLGAHAQGVSTTAWTSSAGVGAFAGFFANDLLSLVGLCLLAVVIALLTRSVAVAVGVSLAYVLVGENLIAAVWPNGGQWFPAHVFGYLPNVTAPLGYGTAPMGYGAALLVALLYMIAFLAVGFALFVSVDISA